MNATPYRKLPALTSLRFFAAAAIAVYHCQPLLGLGTLAQPYYFGQAVSFFFVLSGFILAYTYPQLNNRHERQRFIVARIARIWPTHALGAFFVFMTLPGWTIPDPDTLALNLALVHAWVPNLALIFSWNNVSWSVSVEFGMYLLFVPLIHKWKQTWHLKLAAAFGVVCALGYYFNRTYPPVAECTPEQLQAIFTGMCQHLLPRVFEFVLGMTGALVWQAVVSRYKARRGLGTVLELGAIGLVGLQMYYLVPVYAFVFSVGGLPATSWWITSGCCLSFVVLVMVMACEWGWVSRALALRPLVFLGEISYGIYILHPILLRCYQRWQASFADLPPGTVTALYAIGLLAVSSLVWFCYERPARAFITRLYDRWTNAGKVSTDTPAVPQSVPATATEAETRRAA